MAKRNRIIYGSQSAWADGIPLYRVQTLGATTTFTSEDIFEIGQLDIIDVVDDVPAVAITLDSNEWGDLSTLAAFAQLEPAVYTLFSGSATSSSNLAVVSGAGETAIDYYNGIALADYAVQCGQVPGVPLWAPVQTECNLGTDADVIDMTMYMDEVYINRIESAYTTGANTTMNIGAECDNKMWLLNDGRFVNFDTFTVDATITGANYFTLTIDQGATPSEIVPVLSDGQLGFLRKDVNGYRSLNFYDLSAAEYFNVRVDTKANWDALGAGNRDRYGYDNSNNRVYLPDVVGNADVPVPAVGDVVRVFYAASGYGTQQADQYFKKISDATDTSGWMAEDVGAVRQGQVEIYLVDPAVAAASYELQLRLTSVTLTADLTREPLLELGHLGPYDRPATLPIPITVAVETTAGDLETWAKFVGRESAYDLGTMDDTDLTDLMTKDDLVLVVMIYQQTDEEAGGTASARTVDANAGLVGENWWCAGAMNTDAGIGGTQTGVYAAADREYPLKTVIVKNLKATDEAYTLGMGANATQTYGFRSTNDMFFVQGYVDIEDLIQDGVGTVRTIKRRAR